MIERLRFFELGDDRNVSTMSANELLHLAKVGGGAHKRQRDHVHPVLEAELQISPVFVGHGGNRQPHPREVDALMLAERAAIDHLALDIVAAYTLHLELD